MEKFSTLKEFAQFIHLSPETLRDRIAEGRLQAVKQYRGGNRDDPRSWRWLVSEKARQEFIAVELENWFSAVQRGVVRMPRFMRRARNWQTGRYAK